MSKLPSQRADAARNRKRLLQVAQEQFSNRNSAVTLEAVAQLAGVGIGTLYRHFPTREALVEAVYRSELDALVAGAGDLLREHTACRALRIWMDRYTQFVCTKHAMYDTLHKAFLPSSAPMVETREKIRSAVARFLSAGVEDRSLRGEIEEDDLTVSLAAIVLATKFAVDEDQLRRVLDLLIEGLRPRS